MLEKKNLMSWLCIVPDCTHKALLPPCCVMFLHLCASFMFHDARTKNTLLELSRRQCNHGNKLFFNMTYWLERRWMIDRLRLSGLLSPERRHPLRNVSLLSMQTVCGCHCNLSNGFSQRRIMAAVGMRDVLPSQKSGHTNTDTQHRHKIKVRITSLTAQY